LLAKLRHHPFFIKLLNWEYWPFGILQAPLFFMWLVYGLRQRSLFYFSASNPAIPTGGMMGESKFGVLQLLPEEVRPASMLVQMPMPFEQLVADVARHGFQYPFVVKLDIGERGWMVRRIHTEAELSIYWQAMSAFPLDFIVQKLVDLPLEFGVYYQRYPSKSSGHVTSITGKEFLFVVGDGVHTLQELILSNPRAKLQWSVLSLRFREELKQILPKDQKKELELIGNHCLGTKFLDTNHLITDQLHASFDRLSKQIPGFYFGRYDLRCASLADLTQGRVQVMELNGCGAEPAHIYQPGASLWVAVQTLIRHWRTLYEISVENHQRGVPYLSLREAKKYYRKARARK
jgi:hypothetical protein